MPVSAIVTLDEVYDELNVDEPDDDGGELAAFVDAITAVVEEITGPVLSRTIEEWHDGGQATIILRAYPVLEVTAVTEYSPAAQVLAAEPFGTTTLTGYGYRLEQATGKLIRTTGGLPRTFPAGTGNIKVAYTAGRDTVPPSVRLATLELIRVHWGSQRTGGPKTLGSGDGDDFGQGMTVLGYLVPNRVMEMLSSERRAPRVA